jgi:acetoin utilization protein AcuB
MHVGEYMTHSPFTVSEQTSMKEAVPMLGKHHIRHLPVTNGARLVGIVTDRDIRRAQPGLLLGIGREDYEQVLMTTPVSRIMTREPVTVTEDTPLVDAVRLMVEKKFGSLPVVRGDELIGIFTEIDAMKVLLDKLE